MQARLADLPQQMEALHPEQIDEAMLEQTWWMWNPRGCARKARYRNQNNSEQRIEEPQKEIGELEAREQLLKIPPRIPPKGDGPRAQLQQTSQTLAQRRADLELETLNLTNLRDQLEIAKLRLKLAEQWREQIERSFQQRQEQGRQSAQAELVGRLQADLATNRTEPTRCASGYPKTRARCRWRFGNAWSPNCKRSRNASIC